MSNINRVLIVNRGEIALRIIKTLKYRNIFSVAVYLPEEIESPYVQMADMSIELPSNRYMEFLDQKNLIDICRANMIDAVHLGYGLLSENFDFVKLLEDNNIVHIGCSSASMKMLGNKHAARELASSLKIPVLDGFIVNTEEDVQRFLESHPLPVLFKASYGGGGYGIEIVDEKKEIPERLAKVKEKGKRIFGKGDLYVEQYLTDVRHLEVQSIADMHGNISTFGVRDCSVQHNRQKLVEETVSRDILDQNGENRLCQYTVQLLKNSGYVGVATCEFLYSTSQREAFYIETNTRLQVEHTVTEQQYDIDLVALSVDVACGEIVKPSAVPRGQAIEFRVNLKTADAASGGRKIKSYVEPQYPWLRIDSGVRENLTVSDQFNSLISKVIVKGKDRREAIDRAVNILQHYRIDGVDTSIPLYLKLLADKDYINNDINTTWLEKKLEEFDVHVTGTSTEEKLNDKELSTRSFIYYPIKIENRFIQVGIPSDLLDGITKKSDVGKAISLDRWNRRVATMNSSFSGQVDINAVEIKSSATLISLKVKEGSSVKKGDVIAIIEAMKMEQTLLSPRDGKIADLVVGEGESLSRGDILCKVV